MNNNAKILEENGWSIECESPFEIRHTDGSFATQQAARAVLNELLFDRKIKTIESQRFNDISSLNIFIETNGIHDVVSIETITTEEYPDFGFPGMGKHKVVYIKLWYRI